MPILSPEEKAEVKLLYEVYFECFLPSLRQIDQNSSSVTLSLPTDFPNLTLAIPIFIFISLLHTLKLNLFATRKLTYRFTQAVHPKAPSISQFKDLNVIDFADKFISNSSLTKVVPAGEDEQHPI